MTRRRRRPSASAPPRVASASASAAGTAAASRGLQLREQRREPQLLPEVEVVVRGGAVGAEPDADRERQHVGEPRDAGGELRIRLRAVRDRDVVLAVAREVVVGEPDAVRREHAAVEDAELGESAGVLGLLLRLADVDVQQRVALPCRRGDRLQAPRAAACSRRAPRSRPRRGRGGPRARRGTRARRRAGAPRSCSTRPARSRPASARSASPRRAPHAGSRSSCVYISQLVVTPFRSSSAQASVVPQ